jgi:hypothetical protein
LRCTPTTREVEERGMAYVNGIYGPSSLLELARDLGRPLHNATGELIRELRVVPCTMARPYTLSATFGSGRFPLHTDTAFWTLPARFLVMRAIGDTRRPTTVCPFSDLFELAGDKLATVVRKSVWSLRASTASIYCEMSFRGHSRSLGFRYDRQCMTPANLAAREVDEYITSAASETVTQLISWSEGTAVVIANWVSLHGRGPKPPDEQERIVQRIYVE